MDHAQGMLHLALPRLQALRDELHALGQRPSMQYPSASPNVIEAMEIVQEYSVMCEAMYLTMLADGRVRNVEREVLRGALDVLSNGRARTAHMESLLDAAALRVADQGVDRRLEAVVEALKDDRIRSETVLVLCAAVAAADDAISDQEQAVLDRLAKGLQVKGDRMQSMIDELLTPKNDAAPGSG